MWTTVKHILKTFGEVLNLLKARYFVQQLGILSTLHPFKYTDLYLLSMCLNSPNCTTQPTKISPTYTIQVEVCPFRLKILFLWWILFSWLLNPQSLLDPYWIVNVSFVFHGVFIRLRKISAVAQLGLFHKEFKIYICWDEPDSALWQKTSVIRLTVNLFFYMLYFWHHFYINTFMRGF